MLFRSMVLEIFRVRLGDRSGYTLSVDGRVYFPHSLGAFYEAITQYLGFPNYGDEYKVMGLAPYGGPVYLNAMHEIVRLMPKGRFELNLAYSTIMKIY